MSIGTCMICGSEVVGESLEEARCIKCEAAKHDRIARNAAVILAGISSDHHANLEWLGTDGMEWSVVVAIAIEHEVEKRLSKEAKDE